MKKLLLFALLSIVLVGCSKDDGGFNLAGKTYTRTGGSSYGNVLTYDIRFFNSTEYEYTYKYDGTIFDKVKSTYSLDYPNILLKDFNTILEKDETGTFINEETLRIGNNEYILRK